MTTAATKNPGLWARGFARDVWLGSEVIVQADAYDVGLIGVARAGDGVAAAAQIHVEILDLGRPVLRDAHFATEADGPAKPGTAFAEESAFGLDVAVRQTG